MNFVKAFKQGKEGRNFGLTTGIPQLDQAINGVQRKTTISVAAAPKVKIRWCFCCANFVYLHKQ